jgi:hypothetical protein
MLGIQPDTEYQETALGEAAGWDPCQYNCAAFSHAVTEYCFHRNDQPLLTNEVVSCGSKRVPLRG